jgi:15-cis-phytoene synthase
MAHALVVFAVSRPTSFYYAFLALPRAERDAIVAVWDFCRAVDDTVDEAQGLMGAGAQGPPPTGHDAELRAQLQAWRDEIDACYAGHPASPQGRALQPWIRRFTLPRKPFEDLVDGVEMDLDRQRYASFDDLYEYCWRVASTVGLICIEIFGVHGDRARDYAVNLGVALQLTNILRDVAGDLERGRLYLPLDDLARFGCTEGDLRAGHATGPVRDVLAFEAARAKDYYRRAAEARPAGESRRLVAAEIMAAVYRDLLARIERQGYDVFSSRVRVPRPRQAWLALRVWTHSLTDGRA